MKSDTLVTIASYFYEYEAEIACSMLKDAGIECFLLDQQLSNIQWGYALATGGIRLQVRAQDEPRAKHVLSSLEKPTRVEDEGEATCPRCRSTRVETIHLSKGMDGSSLFTALIALMFMIAIPFRRPRWRCRDCQHKWRHSHHS